MRLGIIGSGKIVHDFLPIAQQIPKLTLSAIATTKRSEAIGKQLAQQYGIAQTFTDARELCQDSHVDTVYVAVPNFLHYDLAKTALLAGKNVIYEKPLVDTTVQAKELGQLAYERHLIVIEAITNLYLENFAGIQKWLPELGPVHLLQLAFIQYSSRYDDFLKGKIAPVFDPQKGGGALMDLNIYNLHLALALFGKPESVDYLANLARGVDTSGVLTLQYPGMQATLSAAKDAYAPSRSFIIGEKGAIYIDGSLGALTNFHVALKGQAIQHFDLNLHEHRMVSEFTTFSRVIAAHDEAFAQQMWQHSLSVVTALEQARDALNRVSL